MFVVLTMCDKNITLYLYPEHHPQIPGPAALSATLMCVCVCVSANLSLFSLYQFLLLTFQESLCDYTRDCKLVNWQGIFFSFKILSL